jgi:hypothetical protein
MPCLTWSILAVLAFSCEVLVSSFVPPHLIVGQAAPVNPRAVFVPALVNSTNPYYSALLGNIVMAPANLHAADALNAVDPFTGNQVSINDATNNAVYFNPHKIGTTPGSEHIIQFDYSYNISGSEFGLQKAQDLIYVVQGSCYTEYQWYQGNNTANGTDSYSVPCDPSQRAVRNPR